MKAGSWYLITFVLTFLYFYIYAVNYVRGASVPTSSLQSSGFHPPSTVSGYVTEEVQVERTFVTVFGLTANIFYHLPEAVSARSSTRGRADRARTPLPPTLNAVP